MRTRSTTIELPYPHSLALDRQTYKSTGEAGNKWTSDRHGYLRPVPRFLVRETEYATDLPAKSQRSTWNNFDHYKVYRDAPAAAASVCIVTNGNYLAGGFAKYRFPVKYLDFGNTSCLSQFGGAANPIAGLPALFSVQNNQISGYTPANINALVDASLAAMLPSIRPELSLVNSIIELKDWRTLPRTVNKLREFSLALRYALQKARVGSTYKWTLKSLLKAASDAYLQKEFNIGPLISDICGIHRALSRARAKAEKLLAQETNRLTRHYYCDLVELQPSMVNSTQQSGSNMIIVDTSPVYNGGSYSGGTTKSQREVVYPVCQFHAQMQYSYYFTSYQREHAKILTLLDELGVNLNPSIVWNALPWTFVVDWVVNVSSWLSKYRMSNMEPVTIIHRYLWSTTVRRTTRIYHTVTPSAAAAVSGVGPISYMLVEQDERAYKRKCFIPSLTNALNTTGISAKEFSLATALAAARVR